MTEARAERTRQGLVPSSRPPMLEREARPREMQKVGSSILLSASDLVGHLHCRRLTALDIEVANGKLEKPAYWDPFQEILQEQAVATKRALSSI